MPSRVDEKAPSERLSPMKPHLLLLLLVALLGLACSAAPPSDAPKGDEVVTIYVEVEVELFREAYAYVREATGLRAPLIVEGHCPNRDARCVRFVEDGDDDWPGGHSLCEAKWQTSLIRCRKPLAVDGDTIRRTYIHEIGHWLLNDYPGVDGRGHSASGSVMAPGTELMRCGGFSAEDLIAICERHECLAFEPACEQSPN